MQRKEICHPTPPFREGGVGQETPLFKPKRHQSSHCVHANSRGDHHALTTASFFGAMQRVFEGRWFYHSIFETQMVHMAGPFTAMLKKKFTITMPIWQSSVELVDNGCKERKSAIQHHHSTGPKRFIALLE